ncbi:MAG: hypothetical protein LBE49_04515 [Deltaproteobacteria bacterium]|jgi:hypothetical protein|nr:hypothetical protein [Deltaproteobacteria bacterium]
MDFSSYIDSLFVTDKDREGMAIDNDILETLCIDYEILYTEIRKDLLEGFSDNKFDFTLNAQILLALLMNLINVVFIFSYKFIIKRYQLSTHQWHFVSSVLLKFFILKDIYSHIKEIPEGFDSEINQAIDEVLIADFNIELVNLLTVISRAIDILDNSDDPVTNQYLKNLDEAIGYYCEMTIKSIFLESRRINWPDGIYKMVVSLLRQWLLQSKELISDYYRGSH